MTYHPYKYKYKALDKLSVIHVLNLVFWGPIFLYWYCLCIRKARSFHNIEMYSWTSWKWPCFRVRGKTEKLYSLGKLKYSSVNFINILLGQFAPIFWRQKLQSWNITRESCAKHFSTKKKLGRAFKHLWQMKKFVYFSGVFNLSL